MVDRQICVIVLMVNSWNQKITQKRKRKRGIGNFIHFVFERRLKIRCLLSPSFPPLDLSLSFLQHVFRCFFLHSITSRNRSSNGSSSRISDFKPFDHIEGPFYYFFFNRSLHAFTFKPYTSFPFPKFKFNPTSSNSISRINSKVFEKRTRVEDFWNEY